MPTDPSRPSPSGPAALRPTDDDALRTRLAALCAEGWRLWERFSADEVERPFHPFVAADYEAVGQALWPHRGRGLRFLEWGSATGVITVMADLLGFEAHGIELDERLVAEARDLAVRFGSNARFVSGSFLPKGYRWRGRDGDARTGTVGSGPSGYLVLGRSLDEFDVVFGYPWDGEEPLMLDLMADYGRPDALLLLNSCTTGIVAYRGGRPLPGDAHRLRGEAPAGSGDSASDT